MFGGAQFQQTYAGTEFAEAPVDVIALTGIAFRWDESITGKVETVVLIAQFDIGTATTLSMDFYHNLPNPVRVVSTNDAHFASSDTRGPTEFDLNFPFQEPFVFDRRAGWLILQGGVAANGKEVDAAGTDGVTGLFSFHEPGGQLDTLYSVLVTKFFYTLVPRVTVVNKLGDQLEIDLAGDRSLGWTLESAPATGSPFTAESGAILSSTSAFTLHATISVNGSQRFYRFRSKRN